MCSNVSIQYDIHNVISFSQVTANDVLSDRWTSEPALCYVISVMLAFFFAIVITTVFVNFWIACTKNELVVYSLFQYDHNIEYTLHNIAPGKYCYYVSRRILWLVLTVFSKVKVHVSRGWVELMYPVQYNFIY